MYDFWYKNEILFTKIWYTFESIFTQKWVNFLLKFVWFCDWDRVKTRLKSPRNDSEAGRKWVNFLLNFTSKTVQDLVQKLYCFDFNLCKFLQNLHDFDYNLCVFCTSCVPFLVILETIIGHPWPKLTVFGSNNDHFWSSRRTKWGEMTVKR